MLKSLLKLFGFAQVAGMVDGGEELCKLLNDIKNGRLGDPNVEMIRSLHSVMHTEFDRIEAELKYDGADRKRVKQTLSILLDATDTTIRQLADDERKLLQAMQEPDSFADLVKREAVALSDNSDERMQAHYERLLEAVAAEYLSLARESPRFNELALIDLLRCFPALTRQVEQFEQDMHKRFDKNDEDHQRIIELLKGHLSPIVGRLHFGSRPDVLAEDRFIERREQEQLNSLIADPTRRRTVLIGMRGCGKTQLAAALAKQCEDANWSLVAWINAVSRESIQSDLVELPPHGHEVRRLRHRGCISQAPGRLTARNCPGSSNCTIQKPVAVPIPEATRYIPQRTCHPPGPRGLLHGGRGHSSVDGRRGRSRESSGPDATVCSTPVGCTRATRRVRCAHAMARPHH